MCFTTRRKTLSLFSNIAHRRLHVTRLSRNPRGIFVNLIIAHLPRSSMEFLHAFSNTNDDINELIILINKWLFRIHNILFSICYGKHNNE